MPLFLRIPFKTAGIIPALLLSLGPLATSAESTPPPAFATTTNSAPSPSSTTSPAKAPAPLLREISPSIFDYHGVRLDKANHRISFPGTVNQRAGAIEYLLVNEKGKVHESVLATKVIPHDIHLALLLIGLQEAGISNPHESVPPSAIDSNYLESAPKLTGPPVQISVAWTQDGKRREISVDRWIFNTATNQLMTPGPWTYNGSLVEDGVFLADQDLSIVSVITDPTALVNNTRKGYDNDEIWQVQESAIPPLDTPVEISITLTELTSKP